MPYLPSYILEQRWKGRVKGLLKFLKEGVFSSGATSENHNNNNNKFESYKTYNPGILGVDRGTMLVMGMNTNFCSNTKFSFLKLLCTLARLFKGTPLQPLILDFFGSDSPVHPFSQLPFITFRGQVNIISVKARKSHERSPLPNLPTPETSRLPPTYQVYPAKVSALRAPLEERFH